MIIKSRQGDYAVMPLSRPDSVWDDIPNDRPETFIAIDRNVAELHPEIISQIASERVYRITATEDEKTLAGVERLCVFLQSGNASKRSRLVVIGGGITQDIGTFAAHVYYRGIPFHFVPTTLLSMADSCIGAKCAVNLGPFKNQLGFFQSPKSVHIWPGFIDTLSNDDVRSGFGEIIKLAIIAGFDDFTWIAEHSGRDGLSQDFIMAAIFRSLSIKQRIIEADEYELGLRKILNYGHTFGHALESITNHGVPHGLAVAWGIDAANYVAMRTGRLQNDIFEKIHEFLLDHFRFSVSTPYDARGLMQAMGRDKKTAGGVATLVLLSDWGKLELEQRNLDATFEHVLNSYLAEANLFK